MPTHVSLPFIWWCRFYRLKLLQKHNFNIETIKKWFEIELIKLDNVNQQV